MKKSKNGQKLVFSLKLGFWPFLDIFTFPIKKSHSNKNDGAKNRHKLVVILGQNIQSGYEKNEEAVFWRFKLHYPSFYALDVIIDFRCPNGLELQVSPSPSPGLKCSFSKLRVDLDRP